MSLKIPHLIRQNWVFKWVFSKTHLESHFYQIRSGIFKWVFKSGICRNLWPQASFKVFATVFIIYGFPSRVKYSGFMLNKQQQYLVLNSQLNIRCDPSNAHNMHFSICEILSIRLINSQISKVHLNKNIFKILLTQKICRIGPCYQG